MHPRVNLDGKLDKKSFQTIKGGKTFEVTIDAAALFDLSAGGKFDVVAEGSLPYSNSGKKKIAGEQAYKSNKVTLDVNGTAAAEAKHKLDRRAILASDCVAGRFDASRNALAVCSNLAYVAGIQALTGNNDR